MFVSPTEHTLQQKAMADDGGGPAVEMPFLHFPESYRGGPTAAESPGSAIPDDDACADVFGDGSPQAPSLLPPQAGQGAVISVRAARAELRSQMYKILMTATAAPVEALGEATRLPTDRLVGNTSQPLTTDTSEELLRELANETDLATVVEARDRVSRGKHPRPADRMAV